LIDSKRFTRAAIDDHSIAAAVKKSLTAISVDTTQAIEV